MMGLWGSRGECVGVSVDWLERRRKTKRLIWFIFGLIRGLEGLS
jgi:hypothetical protein